MFPATLSTNYVLRHRTLKSYAESYTKSYEKLSPLARLCECLHNSCTMTTTVMTLPSYMAGFLHEIGPPGGGVYSYVSYPSAVLPNRPKYRNEMNNNDNGAVNIMHDKRVVRGNTYAVNQGRGIISQILADSESNLSPSYSILCYVTQL